MRLTRRGQRLASALGYLGAALMLGAPLAVILAAWFNLI